MPGIYHQEIKTRRCSDVELWHARGQWDKLQRRPVFGVSQPSGVATTDEPRYRGRGRRMAVGLPSRGSDELLPRDIMPRLCLRSAIRTASFLSCCLLILASSRVTSARRAAFLLRVRHSPMTSPRLLPHSIVTEEGGHDRAAIDELYERVGFDEIARGSRPALPSILALERHPHSSSRAPHCSSGPDRLVGRVEELDAHLVEAESLVSSSIAAQIRVHLPRLT